MKSKKAEPTIRVELMLKNPNWHCYVVCDIGFEPMPHGPKPCTLPDYANHRLILLSKN